ncbi:hypothetical protein GCM10023238_37910 [Streptomyces heliomycini]
MRIADEGGARRLAVGERPLTGAQLHIRAVLDVSADDVLVSASAGEEAADPEVGEVHVYRVNELGVERVSREPGVHSAVRAGGVTVLVSAVPDRPGSRVQVLRDGKPTATVPSYAEDPGMSPRVTLTQGGARRIPCAVLMPRDYAGDTPLPVLMDPYGGPHGQRVLAAHNPHLTSQWFADQGFAVIVADGRGTPGRSPAWEKSVRDDLADVVVQDQVDALRALVADFRSTWTGSPSGAGPSAVTWRPSPSCAAPTSSTRPWWAPRSPISASTTPTTRNGTSATRTSSRRSTAATR